MYETEHGEADVIPYEEDDNRYEMPWDYGKHFN